MLHKSTLAKIHIAKKQLGMDDDTYRAMLQLHGGAQSAKELTAAGAAKVMKHLESAGFKSTTRHFGKRPSVTRDRREQIGKIEAQLADAGRPWSYAEAMAKRMFKIEKLDWLNMDQLSHMIAALDYDAKRREDKARMAANAS